VARLVTALKEIDGVTRVGVNKSSLPTNTTPASSTATTQGDSECQSRDFLAKFEIVAAFDAAPVPAAASAAGAVPAAPATTAPSTDTASSTTASTGG
jgi:hypothetical protein